MSNRDPLDVHMLVVTIAQQGNFVRAAKVLGVAQSSLTRKIASLEQHLGTRLFSRTTRNVELTQAGKVFVMESTASLEHADRAWNLVRYQARIESGPYRIGYSPYVNSSVPALLCAAHPLATEPGIVLESAPTQDMIKRVLRGQLHAAIGIHPIQDEDLWMQPIGREGFVVCVPRNHILTPKVSVTARELDRQTIFWIPRSLHPPFYRAVMRYFSSLGVMPIFKEVLAQAHALELASQGFGLALVPRSAAHVSRTGVLLKPLADRYLGVESVLFMRREQRSGKIRDFIDALVIQLQKNCRWNELAERSHPI